MINDLDRHVVDRFLAAPASRLAIVLSQVVRAGITRDPPGDRSCCSSGSRSACACTAASLGWLVVLAASFLLAMVFAGFSNGVALLLRREASMIATANFVGLPLMFLSSILVTTALMPGWIKTIARFNPVNWGVHAARNAVVVGGALGLVRRLPALPARGHRGHVARSRPGASARTSARSSPTSTQMT